MIVRPITHADGGGGERWVTWVGRTSDGAVMRGRRWATRDEGAIVECRRRGTDDASGGREMSMGDSGRHAGLLFSRG